MKKTLALILSILIISTSVFAAPFPDIEGHWAEEAITKLYEDKAINGDTDGKFHPDNTVSRAEFLKMVTALVANIFEVEIPEAENKTHWADKYNEFALNSYLYANYDLNYDGVSPAVMSKKDYDQPIKRWEMAYILSNAFQNMFMLNASKEEGINDLAAIKEKYDESISSSVTNLVYLKIVTGDENGNFNPENSGTKAEAATLIKKASDTMKDLDEMFTALEKQQQEEYNKMEQSIKESNVTYTDIPKGHPVVQFTMSDGQRFEITLYPEYAPQTCANFLALVSKKFYDGLTFHRIIEGFVAQGGDPNGDSTGGSEGTIFGEFLTNGFEQNTLKHEKGVVSMARSGSFPNSASSQFFICYDTAENLDGNYAAFGKVTKGMNVIEGFLKSELTDNGYGEISRPAKPIKIGKAVVIKKQ